MHYVRPFVLALVLLVLALSLLAPHRPAIAAADSTCDALIVDDAAVFKSQLPQVTAAAESLVGQGADVRIRTIASLGGAATLDSYEKRVEQSCPSWQATDGSRKNNLIAVLIALQERKTGLYYGSQWDQALGPNWTRIQSDLMNPRFRDGDYAGGFVSALHEIQRLVDLQAHQQTVPVGAQPAGVSAAPPDLSGLWRVLLFGLIAALVVTAGAVGYRGVASYSANQSKRRLAQQNALTAKHAAGWRVQSYPDEFKELKLRLDILATQVVEQDVQPLRDGMAAAQRLADAATMQFGAAQNSVLDPESQGLSAGEYDNIRDAYQTILAASAQADEAKSDVLRKTTDLEQAVTDMPERLRAGRSAIDAAKPRLAAVAQLGFKTEQSTLQLEHGQEMVEQAMAALSEKRFSDATRLATGASTLAGQAVSTAERYPALQEALARDVDQAAARGASLAEAAYAGLEQLTAIKATDARSSWDALAKRAGYLSERLRAADALVAEARAWATMQRQEWDKAQAALAQANEELATVESVLQAIAALKDTLDQARQAAPDELAAAQAALDRAEDATRQAPRDSSLDVSAELDAARQKLETARDEARQSRPDVVQVVALAKEARAAADAVYERARAARAERDRREDDRRGMTTSIWTSLLINVLLSGTRSGRGGSYRSGGYRGPRGPHGGGGGGGSTGWGSPGGGGGSSSW